MIRFLVLCGLIFQGLLLSAEVRDLKAFFQARCSVCHGPEGTGRGPGGIRLGGRNLTDAKGMAKEEETVLVTTLLRGRGAMPGFRRQLSEAEARRMVVEVVRPLSGRRLKVVPPVEESVR
jgi:mono/diheme cytochrome c family protein